MICDTVIPVEFYLSNKNTWIFTNLIYPLNAIELMLLLAFFLISQLEKAIRDVGIVTRDTILQRSIQILAYVDDTDIDITG